jgi:hypothetical protein
MPTIPSPPAAVAQVALGFGEPPRYRHQQGERQVGGALGQHPRRVGDQDPAGGGSGHVDVVVANGHVGDDLQIGGGADHIGGDPVSQLAQQRLLVADVLLELGRRESVRGIVVVQPDMRPEQLEGRREHVTGDEDIHGAPIYRGP